MLNTHWRMDYFSCSLFHLILCSFSRDQLDSSSSIKIGSFGFTAIFLIDCIQCHQVCMSTFSLYFIIYWYYYSRVEMKLIRLWLLLVSPLSCSRLQAKVINLLNSHNDSIYFSTCYLPSGLRAPSSFYELKRLKIEITSLLALVTCLANQDQTRVLLIYRNYTNLMWASLTGFCTCFAIRWRPT